MSPVSLIVIGRLIVAGICAAVAGMLAIRGLSGWGWFLSAAVMLGGITISENTDKKGGAPC